MALYAGQSVGLVHDSAPAGDIVARLTREAHEELLKLHLRHGLAVGATRVESPAGD
jgi:hypothetical protein